jgi:hypothetical protein
MIPLISNLTQRGSMFQPLAKKWLFIWNLPVWQVGLVDTHACWWGSFSLSLGDPVSLVRCHWFGKTCLDWSVLPEWPESQKVMRDLRLTERRKVRVLYIYIQIRLLSSLPTYIHGCDQVRNQDGKEEAQTRKTKAGRSGLVRTPGGLDTLVHHAYRLGWSRLVVSCKCISLLRSIDNSQEAQPPFKAYLEPCTEAFSSSAYWLGTNSWFWLGNRPVPSANVGFLPRHLGS